ncbi:skin secretory protein xP2-like [Panicum virgatum]|uniref:skin secretory protein xP2-like n=1 Tax=Panicum virgatum TaxID=38727 RepID=UPI0019D5B3C0|nr:skin secretory protein xP2-like [Panicum virgatum]
MTPTGSGGAGVDAPRIPAGEAIWPPRETKGGKGPISPPAADMIEVDSPDHPKERAVWEELQMGPSPASPVATPSAEDAEAAEGPGAQVTIEAAPARTEGPTPDPAAAAASDPTPSESAAGDTVVAPPTIVEVLPTGSSGPTPDPAVMTESEMECSAPSGLDGAAPTPTEISGAMGAGALVASMPIVGPVGTPTSPLLQSGVVMSTHGSGDGSSLLALTQNFARRELDWGRLRGTVANVAMLMLTLLGLSLVGQEFMEERRMMEEELSSARRALEDERKVRMAELNAARQTLDDVHA